MRVRLLGEVTASADGQGGDLLAGLRPQPRLFLAVLAEDAGRTVSAAWLKDRIWGGGLPADPPGQLQQMASLVRAALRAAPEAGEAIQAAGNGGYRLSLPRDAVDACRFGRLAAEASALYGADDERALALARAALREWGQPPERLRGGEPLAGLSGRWAERFRDVLRARHRDVLIGLGDAELRLGRAQRVITEFAALAEADEAGREDQDLAALLMRAYRQCGRHSDGLRAYRRTAESLTRKNKEPGRELRTLEAEIRDEQDLGTGWHGVRVAHQGELVIAAGQAGNEISAPGTETSRPVAGGGAQPGTGATFTQRNTGRTVLANQGTQHVSGVPSNGRDGAGDEPPPVAGPAPADPDSSNTYTQINEGSTTVANQGVQYLNIGRSDE